MTNKNEKYMIGDIDLSTVRNRNEIRVAEALAAALAALPENSLSRDAVYDVYACALNYLPARYVQGGSIVLRDPVTKNEVELAVKKALSRVKNSPKN